MNFGNLKLFYALSCVALCLIILAPTLALVVTFPEGERFSELWILGSNHMTAGYTFDVAANEKYSVYVGVGNHMKSSAYYAVYVKFKNQAEPLPNDKTETPSPVSPLYTYYVFLQDGDDWEIPMTFSFSGVSFSENRSLVESLTVNDVAFSVDKAAVWDAEDKGYYYQLFLELWIYNTQSKTIQFHNRFVGIQLNITRTV
ncbi:MAG TPA: DUF1616 domain-containing protein [Candidatus Bathyarchaeia archaeon]|nr:DUF1616 domain-containing protein [Candidatus Bathyarchaeia archaeon]